MPTQYPQENGQNDEKEPRRISDCFKGTNLKTIVDKAHFLMTLDRELQGILTAEYRRHCQIMNLEGTTLTMGVSNAALATRLRYQSRDLLSQLKTRVPELISISVLNVKVKV